MKFDLTLNILRALLTHVILKMAEIGFLVSWSAGPYVLMPAHKIDNKKISIVYFHGKNILVCRFKKRSCYTTIVKPTKTPIITPSMHEAKTSKSAS